MKIRSNPQFPAILGPLASSLGIYWRELATLVNAISEGRISGYVNNTTAPTAGTWSKGDFVRNSNPSEAGGVGSKYVVMGWICTASGTPGTWLESRTLTGN